MKTPRLKRNKPTKNYVFVPGPTIPVDDFMKHCPLPPEFTHLTPLLNGPLGQNMLNAIVACHSEGFTVAQQEDALTRVIEFFEQDWHRCNACLNWTAKPEAGALIIDGVFKITAICPQCAAAGRAGRATEDMARNLQEHIFWGGE